MMLPKRKRSKAMISKCDLLGEHFIFPVRDGISRYKTPLGGFNTICFITISLMYVVAQILVFQENEELSLIQYTQVQNYRQGEKFDKLAVAFGIVNYDDGTEVSEQH